MPIAMPTETPPALVAACKCAPIDSDWPIHSPLHALKLMSEWADLEGENETLRGDGIVEVPWLTLDDMIYRITHSHHHEYADLRRLGVERLYEESHFTKCVSIAWHLAGRYDYDVSLIAELTRLGWPPLRFIDFGAACWIQAIYYAKKGLQVTVVNKSIASDAHRFGRWLAAKAGVPPGTIKEVASDDPRWRHASYDVVYCMDVLEHIPPNPDGSPGWIEIADALLAALEPGGIYFANAPFGEDSGVPHPVASHPVHYTSPLSLGTWSQMRGLMQEGYLWRKPT